MTGTTFESQRRAWERIPVDSVGYFPARELMASPDEALRQTIAAMERERYLGERNRDGLWRLTMGLDENHGRVLDYGCGIGIEALQYARSGNTVSVADINIASAKLAARVLRIHGFNPARVMKIGPGPVPLTDAGGREYDMVVMNGVLHHVPNPVVPVQEAHRLLRPGGELRLMVYSDKGWRLATGTEPPLDVAEHEKFLTFVRYFDSVGGWADWYDEARLRERFGGWFDVRETHYIAGNDRYLTARLVREDG